MQAIKRVLPSQPQYREIVLAENQPEYLKLPVAIVNYSTGEVGLISCYRLSWYERLVLLFRGKLWVEQITAGQLQPQRPTVFEPLTEADQRYAKRQEGEWQLQRS